MQIFMVLKLNFDEKGKIKNYKLDGKIKNTELKYNKKYN